MNYNDPNLNSHFHKSKVPIIFTKQEFFPAKDCSKFATLALHKGPKIELRSMKYLQT